jgi:hypothetical protein
MCLAVYLASDKPLPLIEWNEKEPSFYVGELTKSDKSVKIQFEFPYIYYIGSDEGCGCGFFKKGRESDELFRAEENYSKLASYLEKQHQKAKESKYSLVGKVTKKLNRKSEKR